MSEPSAASPDQSLGQLVSSAIGDLRRLIQMEKELAQAELKQTTKRLAPAIGGFGLAAAAGFFFLLIGSIALGFTIGDVLTTGWGFAIVAGAWLLLAAIGGLVGISAIKKVRPPERTIRTVKETADWARHPTAAANAPTVDLSRS